MKGELLFKVLDTNGRPYHGGKGEWPLPNGKPGKWLKVDGDLIPCRHGLHLCRPEDLIFWLGPTIWLAEAGRERIEHENKLVVRRARLLSRVVTWDEKNARLFAADCAEWALKNERKAGREPDKRSWDAIRIVRDYARGRVDERARSAAYSAARSAAYSAAGSAAYSAADSAARSAAYSAADSAADSAARSAAYSAADSAAYSAADSAAYSAADSAACSAADSAARDWQTKRLLRYLKIELA